MTSLSEGLLPAAVGLLNAFLILAIVVAVLYLYRWLVEKKAKAQAPPKTREELTTTEKPRVEENLTIQEVAAAVAAVKHHIKSTLGGGTRLPETLKPPSLWVLSWLNEATQTLDHNPYISLRTRE